MVLANPTIIELNMGKLDDLLQRVEARELRAEDYPTIQSLIESYKDLYFAVSDKNANIARLRKLLFGAKTEKTARVVGQRRPDGNPQAPPTALPAGDAPVGNEALAAGSAGIGRRLGRRGRPGAALFGGRFGRNGERGGLRVAVGGREARSPAESFAAVYHNDAIAEERNLTPAERLLFHQAESGPVMEELHAWLVRQFAERHVEPNSGLGKAISYLLRHGEALTLFLRVAGAPLDNNLCERALKKAQADCCCYSLLFDGRGPS